MEDERVDEPDHDDMQRRIDKLEDQADENRETIRGLREQADLDSDSISDLRAQADADHETIRVLEEQGEVNRAIIAHLEAEGVLDRDKIANLEAALVTARRIGAAMGVLMNSQKVTNAQAFDLLREASQRSHRKLRDVAEEVLLSGVLPNSPSAPSG